MPKPKPVAYLPPGIYGSTLLAMIYPGHRIVVTKNGRPPKRPKRKPAHA